jgi:hypothetical protein
LKTNDIKRTLANAYESNYLKVGGSNDDLLQFIKPLFNDFVEIEAINYRNIINIQRGKSNFKTEYSIKIPHLGSRRNYQFYFIQTIDFLYNILGKDFSKLLNIIRTLKDLKFDKPLSLDDEYLLHILPLLFENKPENYCYNWHHPKNEIYIVFKIISKNEIVCAEIINESSIGLDKINFYDLLELTILNLKKRGYFSIYGD